MKDEKPEVIHGSGNVFRDLGRRNADGEQLKAILAAEIIGSRVDVAVKFKKAPAHHPRPAVVG